jgi:hypothetical protein
MTWTTGGGGLLTSALVVRNIAINSLKIKDGKNPVSPADIFVSENCAFTGLFFGGSGAIQQNGNHLILALISGISLADTDVTGLIVSSRVDGPFDCSASLSATNTVFSDIVQMQRGAFNGCQFNGLAIEAGQDTDAIEFIDCSWGTDNSSVDFAGDAGMVIFDPSSLYSFVTHHGNLTANPRRVKGGAIFKDSYLYHVSLSSGGFQDLKIEVPLSDMGDNVVITIVPEVPNLVILSPWIRNDHVVLAKFWAPTGPVPSQDVELQISIIKG